MNIEEYKKINPEFSESMFITKINNIFVKLFSSIMLDRLEEIRHFVSDDVFLYANRILSNAKDNGNRQMYDELNVKNSTITNIEVVDDKHIIYVYLEARYLDYLISLSDGNYVSGNNSYRIQVNYNLTFVKKSNTLEQGIARKCSNCGHNISVNTSGKCKYCGSIYNQEDYDWVLDKIEIV